MVIFCYLLIDSAARIQRKLMKVHTEKHCGRFPIGCIHCGTEIERERLPDHIAKDCPEFVVDCDYKQFGCTERMKRKERDSHLVDEATTHNQMELETMRNKVNILEDKLQPFMHRNELIIVSSDANRLVYKGNIRSKTNETLPAAPSQYRFHGLGRNIPYDVGIRMGLSRADLVIGPNNIVFGQRSNEIGVYNVGSAKWKSYRGAMKWKNGPMLVSRHHASLLKVGCESMSIPHGQASVGGVIASIKFNENGTFNSDKIGNVSYSAVNPGALILNGMEERLFVCGGWWNNRILRNVEIHHFETGTVRKLKSMIHKHQIPGISQWDRYTEKIIVAGGYSGGRNCIQYVEQYDMDKDMWIDFPKLNKKHNTCPAVWVSNGIVICCGIEDDNGTKRLGSIEIYDPRDSKWVDVGTVHSYFGLPNNRVGGFNNILPL